MSKFVEVKTAELVGPALDWAVAQIEGQKYIVKHITKTSLNLAGQVIAVEHQANYRPSADWAQGGPLWDEWATSMEHYDGWLVAVVGGDAQGHTKLIALCRAIVAAKLGDLVQVPVELVRAGS
ncbi:phage protein NinX family protein [Aeromonas bestiarum]|uniref:phage protein NinX family protein n=1 Tax=Aeromonas bestiarum TaxID=105751 RepID=UPI003D24D366